MKKFKMMVGVNPGYEHGNEGLTPENTLYKGKTVAEFALIRAKKVCSDCQVSLASAIYPVDFGAPKGGELGVVIEGEYNESKEKELIEATQFIMNVLGQQTVVIEYSENGRSLGSAFLSQGGEQVSHLKPNEGLESFSVRIPKRIVHGSITNLGTILQEQMTKPGIGGYLITGVVTEGRSKEGTSYFEYSGTQNPAYGQASAEIYGQSSVELMKRVAGQLGTAVIVELNNESVIVLPEEKAQPSRTMSLENVRKKVQHIEKAL